METLDVTGTTLFAIAVGGATIALILDFLIRHRLNRSKPVYYRVVRNEKLGNKHRFQVQQKQGNKGWQHVSWHEQEITALNAYAKHMETEARRTGKLGKHETLVISSKTPPPEPWSMYDTPKKRKKDPCR